MIKEQTLIEFKEKQYKFVRDNINNHKLNSLTGWIDLAKVDLQKTKKSKKY